MRDYHECWPTQACTYACWACEDSRLFFPPLELSSNFTIESTFELSDESASRAQKYFRILLGWQYLRTGWHLPHRQWPSFIRCTPQEKRVPTDHAECHVSPDGTMVIAQLNGSTDVWMAPSCRRSGNTLLHPGAQASAANRLLRVHPIGSPKLDILQSSMVQLSPGVFPNIHTVSRYFTLAPHGGGNGDMAYDVLLYKGAAYGSRGRMPQVTLQPSTSPRPQRALPPTGERHRPSAHPTFTPTSHVLTTSGTCPREYECRRKLHSDASSLRRCCTHPTGPRSEP